VTAKDAKILKNFVSYSAIKIKKEKKIEDKIEDRIPLVKLIIVILLSLIFLFLSTLILCCCCCSKKEKNVEEKIALINPIEISINSEE
jgi:hypothetical protein